MMRGKFYREFDACRKRGGVVRGAMQRAPKPTSCSVSSAKGEKTAP
jgi:hypothetical protein